MTTCTPTLILTAVLGLAQVAPRGEAPPQSAIPSTEEISTKRVLEDVPNAELISRLPPARGEAVRDVKTDDWIENPYSDEWAMRLSEGRFTSQDLGDAIRRCGMLRSSSTWFAGEPYRVWLRMPAWLPGHTATAIPVVPGLRSAHASEVDLDRGGCGVGIQLNYDRESFQLIGPLAAGTTEVVFRLKVEPSKDFNGNNASWAGEVTLPVEIIGRSLPTPVASPELTAIVQQRARVSCTNGWYKSGPLIWLSARLDRPIGGPLDRTLTCFKSELLKDGKVVATGYDGDSDEPFDARAWDSALKPDTEVARAIVFREQIERYSVRVSGIAPLGPSRWCRPHYWSGEFTVPLIDVLQAPHGIDRHVSEPTERK